LQQLSCEDRSELTQSVWLVQEGRHISFVTAKGASPVLDGTPSLAAS